MAGVSSLSRTPSTDGMSTDVWNQYFRSDVSQVFPTNEDILAEIQSLWDKATDEHRMMYVIRTKDSRNVDTTLELDGQISGGGHYKFVGNSDLYTVFMYRSEALGTAANPSFDLVVPVPVRLKVSTDIKRAWESSPNSNDTREGSANPLFSLDISIDPQSGVDVDTLATRWQASAPGKSTSHSTSPTPPPFPPLSDVKEESQETRSLFHNLPVHKLQALSTWLASQEEVEFVELRYNVYPLNIHASWVTQTNDGVGQNTLLWDKGLTGKGQIVGFSDSGIDMAHCMFRHAQDSDGSAEPGCNPYSTTYISDHRCRKVVQYITYVNDWEDEPAEGSPAGHGTHVAGSLAGNYQPVGPGTYNGMAPDAQLAFFDIGRGGKELLPPDDAVVFLLPAYRAGARVYSVSWGAESTSYDYRASKFDQFLWEHQDMVVLAAAGNLGIAGEYATISPATAKNVITVGATSNFIPPSSSPNTADDVYDPTSGLAFFSSFGPTPDGRLKPEVCAPGQGIWSALHTTTTGNTKLGGRQGCGVAELSGTSMATPVAAGNVVLARQYFMEGFYPTGSAEVKDEFIPSGSLLKAVLVLGAQPLTHYVNEYGEIDPLYYYPDPRQGYGRIQMDRSLMFDGASSEFRLFVDGDYAREPTLQHHGETLYSFEVVDGHQDVPFRAVLTWYDPPTASLSRGGLVNDLDLKVEYNEPNDGTLVVHYADYTHPNKDHENNLEVVTIPGFPGAVNYTVSIFAHSVTTVGNGQPYALAVSGRMKAFPFVVDVPPPAARDQQGGNNNSSSSSDSAEITSGVMRYGMVVLIFGLVAGLLFVRRTAVRRHTNRW